MSRLPTSSARGRFAPATSGRIAVQAYAQTAAGVPHLEKQGTATQLIVDGKPFLALTGELGNNTASARAYRALMRYIKEVDSQQHTVLMMQVENEVGVLRDSRDRSEPANKAFAGPVPRELMD
jgi:hypothetical protein